MKLQLPLLKNKAVWHSWFAWRPVITSGSECHWLVWWQTIYRRRESTCLCDTWWNYSVYYPKDIDHESMEEGK